MSERPKADPSILFEKRWTTKGLANDISETDRGVLCREYEELRSCAPQRGIDGKKYFVAQHDGRLLGSGRSNRFEEHLAVALWRAKKCWPRPCGGWFRLLDYQVPLKARQSDRRIGKVDLLGIADCGRLVVIELKVRPQGNGGRGENPMAALMQGLRYSAIVDSNRALIAKEAEDRFNVKISLKPPVVMVLAPKAWWTGWLQLDGSTGKTAGNWEAQFTGLADDVERQLDVAIEFMALDDVGIDDFVFEPDRREPKLKLVPALYPVRPDEAPAIGTALPSGRAVDHERCRP